MTAPDATEEDRMGHMPEERCDVCATDDEIEAQLAGQPAPDIWWNMPEKRCAP